MRVLLTVLAFLAAAGTCAAATGCPSLTYGFQRYASAPVETLGLQPGQCALQTNEAAAQMGCICHQLANGLLPDECRPYPMLVGSQNFGANTVFVSVPQTRGPGGKCVPDWNEAQPPIQDLSTHRSAPVTRPVPMPVRRIEPAVRPMPRMMLHYAPAVVHAAPVRHP